MPSYYSILDKSVFTVDQGGQFVGKKYKGTYRKTAWDFLRGLCGLVGGREGVPYAELTPAYRAYCFRELTCAYEDRMYDRMRESLSKPESY